MPNFTFIIIEKYKNDVEIWDSMHGFKMSALKKKVLQEAYVLPVDDASVVSEEVVIKKFDLHTCKQSDLKVDDTFELVIKKDCSLTAICGYFSVGFEDGALHKEILSTAPNLPPTHWKQVVFYLPEMIPAKSGMKIFG